MKKKKKNLKKLFFLATLAVRAKRSSFASCTCKAGNGDRCKTTSQIKTETKRLLSGQREKKNKGIKKKPKKSFN